MGRGGDGAWRGMKAQHTDDHPVFRPDAQGVQGSQHDRWQAQDMKLDC